MSLNRRDFIHAGCTLAAVSLLPSIVDKAQAFHHGMVVSSGFLGGKYTLNLTDNEVGGDFPFLNTLLNGGDYSPNNGGTWASDKLDANGYPIGPMATTASLVVFLAHPAISGFSLYAMQITGKGHAQIGAGAPVLTIAISTITPGSTTAIDFGTTHHFTVGMEAPVAGVSGTLGTALNGTGPFVVQSITTTGIVLTVNTVGTSGAGGTVAYGSENIGVVTGGRVLYDVSPASVENGALRITFNIISQDAVTPITKAAFVAVGSEEARLNAGEIFSQHYIDKIKADKSGKIRFLNKMNSNNTTETTWASRKPISYISYATGYYKSSIFAGPVVGPGNDWTLSFGSGAPTDKQYITLSPPPRIAVTMNASGTMTITTASPHNMAVDQTFILTRTSNSDVYPDNGGSTLSAATPLYVISVPTTTTLTFSQTAGGAAVTSTVQPTGMQIQRCVATVFGITFTNLSATVNWPHHGLSVNDPIGFLDRTNVAPVNNFNTYFVKTIIDANNITISATVGGAAIVSGATTGPANIQATREVTLSLNGTAAKSLKTKFAGMVGNESNTIPMSSYDYGTAYNTVLYDAQLGVYLWNGFIFAGSPIQAFWPPEICIELCKVTGTHPHFVMSPYALDPMTDYVPQLATYCKNNCPAWMIPTFEGPNETWNTLFQQTGYASAKSNLYYSIPSYDPWYGMVMSKIGQALKTVYGTTGNGYDCVCGLWTVTMFRTGASNQSDERLNSTNYIATGPTDGSYLRTAAKNYVTQGCMAQYWKADAWATAQEITWGNSVSFFTGSIDLAKNLTVSGVTGAALAIGQQISGSNVPWKTKIVSGSGTSWVVDTAPPYAISGASMYALDMSVAALYLDTCGGVRFMGHMSGFNLVVDSLIDTFTPIQVQDHITGNTNRVNGAGVTSSILQSGTFPNFTMSVSQTVGSAGTPVLMTWGGQMINMGIDYYTPCANYLVNFINDAGNTIKAVGYEGGYSPDIVGTGPTQGQAALRRLSKLVTNSPQKTLGMQDWATTNWTFWKNAGAIFPAEFQFTGLDSINSDAWSYLQNEYMTPAPPQEVSLQNMP